MAVAIIFGLAFATVLTLVLVPTMYTIRGDILDRLERIRCWLFERGTPAGYGSYGTAGQPAGRPAGRVIAPALFSIHPAVLGDGALRGSWCGNGTAHAELKTELRCSAKVR